MSQVDLLYRLQQIDSEIRDKKQRLYDVLQAQKADARLVAAREAATAAESQYRRWLGRQKELSATVESISAKAKKSEERLYSGKVKNTKELTDLQQEIESLGRRRADLEDEVLEAMIMVEEHQAAYEAAAAHLAEVEEEWATKTARLRQEQAELAQRINLLLEKRHEPLKLLSGESQALYEKIGRRANGLAVVPLRQNICQGCQTTVSVQKAKAVREGALVQCGGCDRILYME